MKVSTLVCALASVVSLGLFAAGGGKADPVNPAYPDWQGLTAKNYISGRPLCPSDLRHKATVVIMMQPSEKLFEQFLQVGELASLSSLSVMGDAMNWEDYVLPRGTIVLFSMQNVTQKNREMIFEAFKTKTKEEGDVAKIAAVRSLGCSFYANATFDGAPDAGGKFPYCYVMGPTGKDPLFKGELNAAGIKEVKKAVSKAKKEMAGWEPAWRDYYGNIEEPKFYPQFAKTLAKGKPIAAFEKALLKDVVAKDEEKAKEAQILYDALEQTRSDLVARIKLEAMKCPHRAYYDVQQLLKYWPAEKKRLEDVLMKFKAIPEVMPMAKMFCQLMEWSRPDFTLKNAGEGKKIVLELNKMKKTLEKLKESKNIIVQNGALILDMKVDEAITAVPLKVPSK